MTIDRLIAFLEKLKADKKADGDTPVIWEAIHHTYDVDPRLTTRNGKPVILVNS